MSGIDALADQPLYSESVYLDCVSSDGRTGFVARICRYPGHDTSWLWVHAFTPEGIVAFNDHYLPCSDARSKIDSDSVVYRVAGLFPAALARKGPRLEPASASARAEVRAHRDPHAPYGPGPAPLVVRAEIEPRARLGGSLEGRAESHGRVRAALDLDGRSVEIEGLGHWHEQVQEAPRFRAPFTYATLRGDGLTLVGVIGRRGSRAIGERDGRPLAARALRISPPGPERELCLELADGSELRGAARVTHAYSVPIYAERRHGTLVTAELGGVPLSGCINDFRAN